MPAEGTRERQILEAGVPGEPRVGAGSSVSVALLLTTEPSAQPPRLYLFDPILSLAHVAFAHLVLGFIN